MGRGTPPTRPRQQRGYDAKFDRERARWKVQVDAGRVNCWRCGGWLNPAKPWHLGHDDHDRRIIRGPECVRCNLGAAARKTNAIRRAKAGLPQRRTSQAW